jgi:hypothetical protein
MPSVPGGATDDGAWMSGLEHPGPPPWSNRDPWLVEKILKVPTLAQLRQIATHVENEKTMVFLLGQDAAYDGYLQGFYDYLPPGYQYENEDNSGSWIIVNDGGSGWRKIT